MVLIGGLIYSMISAAAQANRVTPPGEHALTYWHEHSTSLGFGGARAGADHRYAAGQKPREKPMNTEAMPSESGSTSGLSVISSGRKLYSANAISAHFSPIGWKY